MTVKEVADSAELKRRIRRLLATVRSIATDMQIHGRDVGESACHLAGRVSALGRAALASVSTGVDLESLVLDELLAHGVRRAVAVGGPQVLLNARSAELMSLVVHELATNAIKFGALAQPQTQLRVIWWFTVSDHPRLHFEWTEEGVQMGATESHSSGFGSHVVNRLIAHELQGDGKMVFLPGGVHCTIEIPSAEVLQLNE
jgi:two-component system CheB/CheR fusion protein